jgi:hypothetical protein
VVAGAVCVSVFRGVGVFVGAVGVQAVNYIDSRRIWFILVNHAGAEDTDSNWSSFQQWFDKAFANGDGEYRFMGSLGFGGKFWLHHRDGMRVTCYREDETPERLAVIEDTNHCLSIVWGWQRQRTNA